MLIIATHNDHKYNEIAAILAPIKCLPAKTFQSTSPEETGLSFIENALIKARALAKITHTATLADDSGLVVPALNGAPGIFSARYAGPHASCHENRLLLLHHLNLIRHPKAYFYCALAYLRSPDDPTPIITTGIWEGEILNEEIGDNGFGYDPIFYIPKFKKTAAELSDVEKNRVSHRAIALSAMKKELHHLYE